MEVKKRTTCPACYELLDEFIHFGDCFKCKECGFVVCSCISSRMGSASAGFYRCNQEKLREWRDGDTAKDHQYIQLK